MYGYGGGGVVCGLEQAGGECGWLAGVLTECREERGDSSAILQLLYVVYVFVALHVDAEVPLCGGRVVADLASVRLVSAGVALSSREPRVRLGSDAVYALSLGLWVLLLHVYLEGLLVLVAPVALGALEGLARVASGVRGQRERAAAGVGVARVCKGVESREELWH